MFYLDLRCLFPTHSCSSDDTFGSATFAWALVEELDKLSDDSCQKLPSCHIDRDERYAQNLDLPSDMVTIDQRKCKTCEDVLHESQHRERNLSLTVEELRAELRVANWRAFWKDKIYGEQARAGIIVKKAMQKKVYKH